MSVRLSVRTSTHKMTSQQRRWGKLNPKDIIIGNGVWIGSNSTILAGVTIGDGTVIAAGAVVTKDCEANYLYAGVPAKKIKELEMQ